MILSPEDVLKSKFQNLLMPFSTPHCGLILCTRLGEDVFNETWQLAKETMRITPRITTAEETLFNQKVSPQNLFRFLADHRSSVLRFSTPDAISILNSRPCVRILEGALCSSPDSGQKWRVSSPYGTDESFSFQGVLLMQVPVGSVRWSLHRYATLIRDMVVVPDLEETVDKIQRRWKERETLHTGPKTR